MRHCFPVRGRSGVPSGARWQSGRTDRSDRTSIGSAPTGPLSPPDSCGGADLLEFLRGRPLRRVSYCSAAARTPGFPGEFWSHPGRRRTGTRSSRARPPRSARRYRCSRYRYVRSRQVRTPRRPLAVSEVSDRPVLTAGGATGSGSGAVSGPGFGGSSVMGLTVLSRICPAGGERSRPRR